MSTNMTWFRWFRKIFASLCFVQKYSLRIGRVNGKSDDWFHSQLQLPFICSALRRVVYDIAPHFAGVSTFLSHGAPIICPGA